MPKLLDWLALLAYCGLLFWLSDQQQLPMPNVFNFQDKILHAGAYFVLAVIAWRALSQLDIGGKALAWSCLIFCSAYGLSDEWHQSFVPGRSSSVADWLADTIGAASAITLMLKYFRFRYRESL